MSFWGKPNIEKMIENRNIKGLWKASENDEYEIRKEAILGLIGLNELLPNFFLPLSLINDIDKDVRDSGYFYSLIGEIGFYSNIAALHDRSHNIRKKALDNLYNYHKNKSLAIIKKCSILDPNSSMRIAASSYSQEILMDGSFDNDQFDFNSNQNLLYNKDFWHSNLGLMEDLVYYLKIDYKNNITSLKTKEVIFTPEKSPVMHFCQKRFLDAFKILKEDESQSVQILNIVLANAIEGLNTISRMFPQIIIMDMNRLPFQNYLACTTIMLTRMDAE